MLNDSYTLDAVLSVVRNLDRQELKPEPGRMFVVRDSRGNFLREFHQGRERTTTYPCHAHLFDDLHLAVVFGAFWRRIARVDCLPIHICQVDVPREIKILSYGKDRLRPEPWKPFWHF